VCSPFLLPAQEPKPEPVHTSITVSEKIEAETPANVSVMDRLDIEETPGTNLDDRLRDVPGFSLFRRNPSLVANPTTQGVSLRGLGSSGASRSLVVWDGIPANDPFGGWVYWTRLSPGEMGRVEISRGASTSLFGDRAMAGAIAVFTRQPERSRLTAAYEGGNLASHDVSAGYAEVWSAWALSGYGRAFTTDGYYLVDNPFRGAADHRAGVRFVTGDLHIDHYSRFGNFFFKTDVLAEERQNGTALTQNSTGLGTVSLRYEKEFASDVVSLVGFHTREGYRASFSSVSADRNTERLSYTQTVPSEAVGGAATWRHHQRAWNLIGGADVYRVEGTSTDHLVPSGQRVGGGTQLQHGVFGQADLQVGPVRFFAGLRHSFSGQDTTFLSPSAGLSLGRGRWRARGSAYRSFRAPTLNELFREFRAGNTITMANRLLRPEKVFGAEAGFDWTGESGAFRFTAFRNSLTDLITNITLSSSPTQIVRQRGNAASALSRGMEAEYHQRLGGNFRGEVSYLFADSRYSTGERIPQVPRHQGSGQVVYLRGRTLASLGVRSYAAQFDDDRNQFLLPGFATVQLMVRQRIVKSFSASASVENLLDRGYLTSWSTPTVPTVGAPRLWRVGLRWDGAVRR
jgi:outer membrane receptor protein involved in Fe transport